jgi:hypothetical protein
MSTNNTDDQNGLPPPGTRWGSGAQSVLPYLTKSLQGKPAHAPEAREPRPRDGNPVFTNWPPRSG